MNKIWERIKGILPQNKFTRNVILLASGTIISQIILTLSSPVLTRLYKPEDFGVLSVYISIISMVNTVVSLRYEFAIPLPESDEVGANLMFLAFWIMVAFCSLFGIGLFQWGTQLVIWTKTPILQSYLWLIPIGLFMMGFYQILNYWAIRKKAFSRISRTKLSQSIGQVMIQVSFGIMRLGPLGLLIGQIVGSFAGSGTLMYLAWQLDQQNIQKVSLKGMWEAAKRYRRFPLIASYSGLLNSAGLQIPSLILASIYGSKVVGLFALSQRVIAVPMTLIGTSVSQVYVGEAATLARSDPKAWKKLYKKTVRQLFLIGLIPTIVLGAGGAWIFSLFFGKAWYEAGVYTQIMALMFLAQFVTTPISMTFSISERQDLALAWNLGRLIMVIGGLVLAEYLNMKPIMTIGFYSINMLISYVGLFLLSSYALRVPNISNEAQ
jgi:O-antigen/teichoic acid export membrane protein